MNKTLTIAAIIIMTMVAITLFITYGWTHIVDIINDIPANLPNMPGASN